jgi:hypothetical protein
MTAPARSAAASSSAVNAGDCRNHPTMETATKAGTTITAAAAARGPRRINSAAPTAAPTGTKKANWSIRFGGPHAVRPRTTIPTAVTAAQDHHSAVRKRRSSALPRRRAIAANPIPAATGTAARLTSPQNRSRYRSTRRSTNPSRRKKPSCEVSPGMPGSGASSASPATASPPPAPTATPIRAAAVSRHAIPSRCLRAASGMRAATTRARMTRPTPKNTRWVSPEAARRPAARPTAAHERPASERAADAARNMATMATLASQPPAR